MKDTKEIDFMIASEPLTELDRKEITKFINDYKKTKSNSDIKVKATKSSKRDFKNK
jgi:hypothetical protein